MSTGSVYKKHLRMFKLVTGKTNHTKTKIPNLNVFFFKLRYAQESI